MSDQKTASFTCPNCQKRLRAKAELAGKSARCPACGSVVTVPSPDKRDDDLVQKVRSIIAAKNLPELADPYDSGAIDAALSYGELPYLVETVDDYLLAVIRMAPNAFSADQLRAILRLRPTRPTFSPITPPAVVNYGGVEVSGPSNEIPGRLVTFDDLKNAAAAELRRRRSPTSQKEAQGIVDRTDVASLLGFCTGSDLLLGELARRRIVAIVADAPYHRFSERFDQRIREQLLPIVLEEFDSLCQGRAGTTSRKAQLVPLVRGPYYDLEVRLWRCQAMKAIGEIGEPASAAVPRLVDMFIREADEREFESAATALCGLGFAARTAVPELIALLAKGAVSGMRLICAIWILEKMGSHAAPALPVLRELCGSTHPKVCDRNGRLFVVAEVARKALESIGKYV